MKRTINKIIEYVVYITNCAFVGAGIGTIVCKILGEDAWSWKNWSTKHKVIYWIVSAVALLPCVIWMAAGHVKLDEAIDDEFDDEK